MAKAPTVITAGIVVSGRIEGAEDIAIYGAVKGSVHLDGDVFVDEKARVDADLEVNNLTVRGVLVGNVTASESIELAATARVIGDLTSPRIIVEAGALYRGAIDMGDIEDEIAGEDRSSRSKSRSSSRSAPSRPAPARPTPARASRPEPTPEPERPKPAPSRPSKPKAEPEPEPMDDDIEDDDDDEPELPGAAKKKKVAVKKRS